MRCEREERGWDRPGAQWALLLPWVPLTPHAPRHTRLKTSTHAWNSTPPSASSRSSYRSQNPWVELVCYSMLFGLMGWWMNESTQAGLHRQGCSKKRRTLRFQAQISIGWAGKERVLGGSICNQRAEARCSTCVSCGARANGVDSSTHPHQCKNIHRRCAHTVHAAGSKRREV